MSKIGTDVSEKLFWKNDISYFNNEIKEDIFVVICHIHNINQDKVKNIYSYGGFMNPLYIYILWVFYIRILSIFHNSVDPSISGGLIPRNLFYCPQGNNHKRFVPRVTKVHWVNPYQFILSVCNAIISRESSQGTISPIGLIPSHFFTSFKAIIPGESLQGELSPIGLIPSFFKWLQGDNIKRFGPRGTKVNWVNPYQFFYWPQGNNLKRVLPRGTKDHWVNP